MTLDKAIKQLETSLMIAQNKRHIQKTDALYLGIEALKRIKGRRDLDSLREQPPLPGETEN